MSKSFSRLLCLHLLFLVFLAGCAKPLPSTYVPVDNDRVLDGPILVLAGEGDLVAAVNHDGLFMKNGNGPWINQEVPGLRKWNSVTCLAIDEGKIYLGSDGEGLHIFSEGAWEVRTSRYGGLADDGVLSIAIDGNDEGLPGTILWVGTRKGVAAYREGDWVIYTPDENWLVAMTGKSGSAVGKVYVSSGFKLGAKGEDSGQFNPPVAAISVGPDRIAFANMASALAIVSGDSVATYRFLEKQKFTHLVVEEGVIWAGTDKGLMWGGLRGVAQGKPWPTTGIYMGWTATLFGSRDTRGFEYRWKWAGYNMAMVMDLEKSGPDLWVAFQGKKGNRSTFSQSKPVSVEETKLEMISDVRRFVEINDYISKKQSARFESYGAGSRIRGEPKALYISPDNSRFWFGTTRGLWELTNN